MKIKFVLVSENSRNEHPPRGLKITRNMIQTIPPELCISRKGNETKLKIEDWTHLDDTTNNAMEPPEAREKPCGPITVQLPSLINPKAVCQFPYDLQQSKHREHTKRIHYNCCVLNDHSIRNGIHVISLDLRIFVKQVSSSPFYR